MRTTMIAAVAAAAMLTGAAPATADAASIRECSERGLWVENLTTRGAVSCSTARSFASSHQGRSRHWGYRCRISDRYAGPASEFHGYYIVDTRCTRGSRVIRWQFGVG